MSIVLLLLLAAICAGFVGMATQSPLWAAAVFLALIVLAPDRDE